MGIKLPKQLIVVMKIPKWLKGDFLVLDWVVTLVLLITS